MKAGKADLKGTKYDWLSNPKNMTRRQKQRFKALRDSTLKTARAWAIKELAMSLWGYVSKTWARKGWARWLSWAVRCRLEPMKKVAKTIKKHLWGILNAIVLKVSNGPAEGINSRIKAIKVRSHGFRNKERFANAIYFHLGGLDLYPEAMAASNCYPPALSRNSTGYQPSLSLRQRHRPDPGQSGSASRLVAAWINPPALDNVDTNDQLRVLRGRCVCSIEKAPPGSPWRAKNTRITSSGTHAGMRNGRSGCLG